MHGAKTYGRPSKALDHGRESAFTRNTDLPKVAEIVAALGTHRGKEALMKTAIATSELRVRTVDDGDHASFVAYRNLIRSDLGALTTLEGMNAPTDQAPVYQIATFDENAGQPMLVRGVDGPLHLVRIAGVPHIRAEGGGAWLPAREFADVDTGAALYEPLALDAGDPESSK